MRRALWAGLLVLASCDDHTFPTVGENGQVGYAPTWSGTQDFLSDHCESCHPSLNAPDFPGDVADDIVNGTGRLVVPGDPESSELWLVITGQSQQTAVMPLGSTPLPIDVIQPISDWIAAGAPLE
ncbi:MAG: hypothetical protein H6737_08540 [Alphaproteobacteria bacterium]|nr:hypothetical protein [Alphaproteobacteria bacterium]